MDVPKFKKGDNRENRGNCYQGDKGKTQALREVTIAGEDIIHFQTLLDQRFLYDSILSARFLARNTTDEAAMFTPKEIRNKTIPMKNKT